MSRIELPSENGDEYVCERCFSDQGLASFIRAQDLKGLCSFCDPPGKRARPKTVCSFDVISEYIFECLSLEWTEVSRDTLPFDSEEQ